MEIEVLRGMAETLKRERPKLVVEVHSGVNRHELLSLLQQLGYTPEAAPIEPIPGETQAAYLDDHSYFFAPV